MTSFDSAIEAKILASAAKDPQLDNDTLHAILLKAANMEPQDALSVLERCAENSALNTSVQIEALLKTTKHSLAQSSAKQHFIYGTLLERKNLTSKDVDAVTHFALREPQFNSAEIMTATAALSHPKTEKETAEYINEFYVSKLPDDNQHKNGLVSLLKKRFEIEPNGPATENTNQFGSMGNTYNSRSGR